MEINNQTEKQQFERELIQDTYNDEHWLKKYGVSAKELIKTGTESISAKIIEATIKNKSFSV